ncbi:hypothetical protein EGW08_013241, partial [Elysia chlorotica]
LLTLSNKVLFKFCEKFKIKKILRGQGFLSYHSFHGLHIFPNSIASILKSDTHQLVRNISMILSCHIFSNGRFHQPRQRWKHIDGRIDLHIKKLSMNYLFSLTILKIFVFFSIQGFTIIRHSKNGNLGDGTISAFNTTSSLIDCGQISVHVTRETTTSRHFFSGSRYLKSKINL